MSFQEFTDYSGPTGAFVANGSVILALDSAEGLSAVAQSAMLTSLGASPEAEEYAQKVAASLEVAHDLDPAGVGAEA